MAKRHLMTLLLVLSTIAPTMSILSANYTQLPQPVKAAWSDMIWEYIAQDTRLIVGEKQGVLQVIIDGNKEIPLQEMGGEKFKFPSQGPYADQQLTFLRDNSGKINSISLSGISFLRRHLVSEEGSLIVAPVSPIAILEQEALKANPPKEVGEFKQSDLVDVTQYSDVIKLDIRYAGTNNFLGTPVYSSAHAFLQRPAAEALARISKELKSHGYGLLVHDGYRPWYVTKIFWDATPENGKIFVADPSKGSRHNRGSAIDLTLYDLKTGKPIEMVGLYDEMSERSYPSYLGGTSLQRWHRDLLKDVMEENGFKVYEYEWWHFDFDGWDNYSLQNDTFEQLQ